MVARGYIKNKKTSEKTVMDILQQSLQAAEILSGDDLFGELGLNLDSTSSEAVGLPNELEALVSQTQPYGSAAGLTSQTDNQPNYFGNTDSSAAAQFDTSQFLNTSASINASAPTISSDVGQQNQMFAQCNDGNATNSVNVQNLYQTAYSAPSSIQYMYQQQSSSTAMQVHGGDSTTAWSPFRNVASTPSQSFLASTVSVTQAYSTSTCSSVFSRAPTQTVLSTAQMNTDATGTQNVLPAGIQVANQQAFQSLPSTATEKLQVSNTGQNVAVLDTANVQVMQQNSANNLQNTRQLLVMQKYAKSSTAHTMPSNQLVNGIGLQQPQANMLGQNRNVAVLRVSGGKQNVNLNDPQLMKALTANLVQKQQVDTQTSQQSQQQFLKLGQNNSFVNATSRAQQQTVVQKPQHLTLQNGQTILLNNGQQVQLCNPPSQMLQQFGHQNTTGSDQQVLVGNQPVARNSQLPIKGIQIASVNIPIASTALNVNPVQSNVMSIPVLAKHDVTVSGTVSPRPTASPQAGRVVQLQNSSAVRSLLANSILKQNNNTSSNNAVSMSNAQRSLQSPVQAAAVNGHASGNSTPLQRAQLGTTLRLNLTAQQASQLTTTQLQSILKQHQAAIQARAAANAGAKTGTVDSRRSQSAATPASLQKHQQQATPSPGSLASILRPSTSNNLTHVGNSVVVNKTPSSDQTPVQEYRVDPTLTEEKADEVKKLLANRTTGVRMNSLTREQQQLVLAFQAQIKAMCPPVQQYYLRNPQLFMQKVMQQIRAGKPFILHVKADPLQNKSKVVATTVTPSKPQHPTISLSQDPPRLKRIATPTPVTGMPAPAPIQTSQTASPAVMKPIIIPTPTATVTVQVPRKAIKRPAPEPTQNVSLVLEQLECHKRMVTAPDCTQPFMSVRDAIRRLVPFHTYNIPNVKEENFVNSEKIFDRISDRIMARTRAMVNKYHLLCLRDSTRDSCSAEMVMIERMFLQKEKAKLAEDKLRIKADPSVIREYFPNTTREPEDSITVEIADDDPRSRNSSMDSSYLGGPTDTRSGNETDISSYADSPAPNSQMSAYSRTSAISHRTNLDGRSYSHDSFASPENLKQPGSVGAGSHGSDEVLLQEAVDSILM